MSTALSRSPRFRSEDAARLAREIWGVDGEARELPSERDQNFEISTGSDRFVLKRAERSERPETLAMQNAALECVAARAPHLPVPRVRPSRSGAAIVEVGGPENE